MARYPDRRSASIPALWAVQRRYGWCTPEGIRQAAAVMRVTPAYLESVASFYDLLHTEPVGTHGSLVCTNICCWMRGGDELLDAFSSAGAPRATTSDVLRHRLRVPRRLRHRPDGLDRRALLRPAGGGRGGDRDRAAARRRRGAAREGAGEARRWRAEAPDGAGAASRWPETRVLLEHADEPGAAHARRLQAATAATRRWRRAYRELEPDEVLKELEDSGLRGRGGAGFSMGKKASFLPRGEMDKYLCCNADESEPGAFKDRELMQQQPAPADRGDRDRRARRRRRPRLHLHPRRVRPPGRHPRRRRRRGLRGGLPRRGHPRQPPRPRAGRPPRRRRLHLRRGDGAARRARGQARQPAPEAARSRRSRASTAGRR